MKKNTHPQVKMVKFKDISTGTVFTIASTTDDMSVEISSASHPFYTGQERVIDTENRVEKFEQRTTAASASMAQAKKKKDKRKERKKGKKVEKVKGKKALTLRDMLKNAG